MGANFDTAGMDRQQRTSRVRLRYAMPCSESHPVPFAPGDVGFQIERSPSN